MDGWYGCRAQTYMDPLLVKRWFELGDIHISILPAAHPPYIFIAAFIFIRAAGVRWFRWFTAEHTLN